MSSSDPIFARVLLTNDDGIDAPGLAVLAEVAATLAREVWTVAPEHDQSGVSHALSLHSPLRVITKGERCFAVRGTPSDCVALAIGELMGGLRPDIVLSGINRGANLGVDTVFSGTVGAAMIGMLLGVPSIALSQAFTDSGAVPWDTSLQLAPGVIRRLCGVGWGSRACLNVNFPACPAAEAAGLSVTRQDAGMLDGVVVTRSDPRNLPYHWLQLSRRQKQDASDSETAVVTSGHVTVTPLRFEHTDEETFVLLGERLV
jgi:5'-nucleotidase